MGKSFENNSEKSINFMEQMRTNSDYPKKQHDTLMDKLNRINRQTDEVLSRLEDEVQKRNVNTSS